MTLDKGARVWDPTGSAAADHIVMNQKSGDFTADGHVASTRMPDQKGNSSAMLSTDEIMQARAQHMVSTDNNLKIHYEATRSRGRARIAWKRTGWISIATRRSWKRTAKWSASSSTRTKIKTRTTRVDGEDDGERPKRSRRPAAAPIFTVVHAPDLVYTEETRDRRL